MAVHRARDAPGPLRRFFNSRGASARRSAGENFQSPRGISQGAAPGRVGSRDNSVIRRGTWLARSSCMPVSTLSPAVQPRPWHAMPPAAVLTALGVTDAGLSTRQANARLVDAGPNSIPTGTPASAWQVLLTQFRSVVTLLLMSALLIAALTGDAADAIAIAAVLILNVALGFAVEIRAHRAVEALADVEPRIAVVLRDGL